MFWFIKKTIKISFYLVGTLLILISIFFISLPNVSYLRGHNPKQTRFMEIYLDKAKWEEKNPTLEYNWRSYDQISGNLKRAVMAAEDDAFFMHRGFNWREFGNAIKRNWRDKSFKFGGSTITQQLVKNLYLTPDKNLFRKLREWIVTYQMEKTLTKKRIFELYLNVAEWGPGVYGAEAAAKHYFGKSARSISPREAAYLAAILPNPQLYTAQSHARATHRKAYLILQRMNRM